MSSERKINNHMIKIPIWRLIHDFMNMFENDIR